MWGSVNGRADRLTERTKGTVGGTKKKERRKERNRKPYRHEVIELTLKKDVLFIIEDLNANVGSQGIAGVTDKFCLEYKMK